MSTHATPTVIKPFRDYRIVDVAETDSAYARREQLIGQTIHVIEVRHQWGKHAAVKGRMDDYIRCGPAVFFAVELEPV